MSMRPRAFRVPATSASNCSFIEMLQGIATARPPDLTISPAVRAQASALRLEITTDAPCAAMASAIARPMPLDEPVISAVLPSRRKRSSYFMAESRVGGMQAGKALRLSPGRAAFYNRSDKARPAPCGGPRNAKETPMNLDLTPEL